MTLTLSRALQTFGVIRVPLVVLGDGVRGLPVFLANRFAGNAREQLLFTLRKFNIIPEDQLTKIMEAANKYKSELTSSS